MWGQLAAATIGALGARKTAKAMQGANDLDLAKLRREAEQNGFNPLTVLRATGGQGSTKGPSGNLASGAFFQTFAQGIPSILEANYNKKMKQAQLTNINASTQNLLASAKSMQNERGRDDVPLLVTAYDPTGKLADFLIPNPEVLEFSPSEFGASLSAIAASFAMQNNITKAEAKDILLSIYENRKSNIAKKQKPSLESNPDFTSNIIKQGPIKQQIFGFREVSDDPIFQWAQDFFNDAKRVYKENHGS